MHIRMLFISAVLAFSLAAAQAAPTQNSALPSSASPAPAVPGQPSDTYRFSGMWGGTGISMTVTESGAQIDYDCAKGTIEGTIKPDHFGDFEVKGTHTRLRP